MVQKPVLVNQPTKKPTRKVGAVIATSVILGLIQLFIESYAPGLASQEMFDTLNEVIYLGIVSLVGYMVREYKQHD